MDLDLYGLIAAERRRAADMFAALDAPQLAVRSLCSEWTVREVAAHLISPFVIGLPRFLFGAVTQGGFHRFSVKATRQLAQRPIGDTVATLRANADNRFAPPGMGPGAPLTDICLHTRDAARPLGLDVSAPVETWRSVLDFVVSPRATRGFIPRGRLAGLRFEATDQDWSYGQGATVTGPSEALALAMGGRTVALGDLDGEGVAALRARLH